MNSPQTPARRGAGSRIRAKHPLAIRWFHWINFPVLMGMIWSGLLIYWANDVYRVGSFRFFPQSFYDRLHVPQRLAEGMAWHFALAWIFALNGLGYVLYVAFSGEWRHLLPGRRTLREALDVVLHELRIRKSPLPRAKFNGAQRIAYTGVVVMGAGSLLTGLAILKPVQLAWISSPLGRAAQATGSNATAYEAARWLHFWLTIGFCAFFLVHVLQVARAGWNNFRAMVTGYEIVREPAAEGAPADSSPTRSDSTSPAQP
jgi:thiosulfate reductase cytochrome b subunit